MYLLYCLYLSQFERPVSTAEMISLVHSLFIIAYELPKAIFFPCLEGIDPLSSYLTLPVRFILSLHANVFPMRSWYYCKEQCCILNGCQSQHKLRLRPQTYNPTPGCINSSIFKFQPIFLINLKKVAVRRLVSKRGLNFYTHSVFLVKYQLSK